MIDVVHGSGRSRVSCLRPTDELRVQDLQIAYIYANPNALGSKDCIVTLTCVHICCSLHQVAIVLWTYISGEKFCKSPAKEGKECKSALNQDNLDFAQGHPKSPEDIYGTALEA